MAAPIREEQQQLITWSMVILAGVAIAASLYWTRTVTVPFILAMFLTAMASPVIDYQMERWKFSRLAAVIVAMLLVVGIVLIFGLLLVVAVQIINSTVRGYSENFAEMSSKIFATLHGWGLAVDEADVAQQLKAQLPGTAKEAIGSITSMLTSTALTLIFAGFLLTGNTFEMRHTSIYREIDRQVRKYLAVKIFISIVTGLLVAVILWFLGVGVQESFVFGVLTFMLNFIPSLGSILATFLPLPIAIAKFESVGWIILVVALPGAVQLLMGNIIEPKLQGQRLRLHPAVIILSLMLWGLVWGVSGMVLAVPMTATVRVILLQFATTRPLGRLLAGELPHVELSKES